MTNPGEVLLTLAQLAMIVGSLGLILMLMYAMGRWIGRRMAQAGPAESDELWAEWVARHDRREARREAAHRGVAPALLVGWGPAPAVHPRAILLDGPPRFDPRTPYRVTAGAHLGLLVRVKMRSREDGDYWFVEGVGEGRGRVLVVRGDWLGECHGES